MRSCMRERKKEQDFYELICFTYEYVSNEYKKKDKIKVTAKTTSYTHTTVCVCVCKRPS